MAKQKPYRLPTTVAPERYEIRLTPDLSRATFAGEEKVVIQIVEPVRQIIVNAAELEFQAVSVRRADGKVVRGDAALDNENEQAMLEFPESLAPGRWELQLTFSGILNDKLHGFYRSTYKDAHGQDKTLASTQFESTDARRAFPCWDEPAFKAVFQVTLVIDEGLTAISNARTIRENPVAGTIKKEVVLADTIKMSTYLVAFIVGEFEGTEPVMVGSAPLRVWAVPGKRTLAKFAQAIGSFSLSFFSRYYGIPYPGDKLDLIAIPDFASGAMENLGAITFMETLAVDAWKPEWRRWDSFTVSRAAAMQVDGLKSTRPIEFPVEKPEEAAGMFDVLTYEKGASVLRMLEQYLGDEAFRDGIRLYLRRHEYGNAETTDLWDALEESTRQPTRAGTDFIVFATVRICWTPSSKGCKPVYCRWNGSI